jgi:hypothetical protein
MNSTTSRPKKSPSSKARHKQERGVHAASPSRRKGPSKLAAASSCERASKRPKGRDPLRAEFRAWRESLPTQLERDTLLWPEVIAETVVQEAERFLKADLPGGFAERLAARAYYLYPRNRHFHKSLNRPGNSGRDILYVYMRHWTAGWLTREGNPLRKKLPESYAMGWPLRKGVTH